MSGWPKSLHSSFQELLDATFLPSNSLDLLLGETCRSWRCPKRTRRRPGRTIHLCHFPSDKSCSSVIYACGSKCHDLIRPRDKETPGNRHPNRPFCDTQLNPNSYNLRLHNELLVYEEVVLDIKAPNRYRRIEIPESGLVMSPSRGLPGPHRRTHRDT